MLSRGMTQQQYVAFVRFTYRAEWSPLTDNRARVRSRKGSITQTKSYGAELLYCGDIFLLHRLFQARSRGSVQTKTFRKGSEASSRAERRHGYVILVSSEPRCYHAATSERRRIQSRADNNIIALRGASVRRSQRGNSEAVFFRWTLPRRTASGVRNVAITRRHHKPISTTFVATLLSTCLSCAVTARRTTIYYFSTSSSVYRFCGFVDNCGQTLLVPQYVFE